MKTQQTNFERLPASAGSDLGEVLFTVPAHEYHYWGMALLHPFRDKVRRVKKAKSSGATTRRELENALKWFDGKWQAEELKNILNDLNASDQATLTRPAANTENSELK